MIRNKTVQVLSLACFFMISFASCNRGNNGMTSPNGKIQLSLLEQPDGATSFDVIYNDGANSTNVIGIPLIGVLTESGRGVDMRLKSVDAPVHIVDKYRMLTGKQLECENEANGHL